MDNILRRMKEDDAAERRGRRAALWFFGLFAAAFVLWLGGALTGLLPLGFGFRYEQWSDKPENLYGVSGWRTGPVFGTGLFYFRAGERLYVDYDVTVYQGDFTVHVMKSGGGLRPLTAISHTVTTSGEGRLEGTIPQDGFYRFLHYAGLKIGSGTGDFEADYYVAWGFVR